MIDGDLQALLTSIKLALVTVAILLIVATPLAWWLARSRSALARIVEVIVTLPLVLPPTVLGFYLLILMGPAGSLGQWWVSITGTTLTFSFTGLVIASLVHSLPFAVQPLVNAFQNVGSGPIKAAMSLGAHPRDVFFSVTLPLAKSGYFAAAILVFAHTLGEFGVLLMVGGNIPGETRIAAVAIYDHVEALDYASAHQLALTLLGIALAALIALAFFKQRPGGSDLPGSI